MLHQLVAQVQVEVAPPPFIKTVDLRGPNEQDPFPIVRLGQTITLTFDDLRGREEDFYYTIEHCNFNWTLTPISKPEYLDGFDDQRIRDYENSYNTLQPYSHYMLRIPNDFTRLRLSGNYIMKIYDRQGEFMFSRRFVVYQDRASVSVSIHRSRDMRTINKVHTPYFTISTPNVQLRDPANEVKVMVMQNYRWETAIPNLKPQYSLANDLVYRYDKESNFMAGNEFLNFDSKDIRGTNVSIRKIERKNIYNHYLSTSYARANKVYTYNPDINGDFVVRTLQGTDSHIEADYVMVHFGFDNDQKIPFDRIFVVGKFNNYQLTEENELHLNKDTGLYECKMLIKQGFYNYRYVIIDADGNIKETAIGGDFWQTENQYTVLVYYRIFDRRYDSLIGVGSASSLDIQN